MMRLITPYAASSREPASLHLDLAPDRMLVGVQRVEAELDEQSDE